MAWLLDLVPEYRQHATVRRAEPRWIVSPIPHPGSMSSDVHTEALIADVRGPLSLLGWCQSERSPCGYVVGRELGVVFL